MMTCCKKTTYPLPLGICSGQKGVLLKFVQAAFQKFPIAMGPVFQRFHQGFEANRFRQKAVEFGSFPLYHFQSIPIL